LLAIPVLLAQGPYSDKSDLLYYLNSHGVRRVVRKTSDWQHRRAHILSAMQKVMGPLPANSHAPVSVEVLEEVREGKS
jgi:hypothetical protein